MKPVVSAIPITLLALVLAACLPEPRTPSLDEAIDRGVQYLIDHQSPDGMWRSQTYGVLRNDPALTAHVLKVLRYSNHPDAPAAFDRGLAAIEATDARLAFPSYTISQIIIALSLEASPARRARVDTWAARLLEHQSPSGGWGYGVAPAAEQIDDANLSATLFALGALRFAGVPDDHPAVAAARSFVERCQNLDGDGGFFFSTADPAANKAGADAAGRFRSYGSATADGLRALIRVGYAPDDARVLAAERWLVERFDPASVPGDFADDRESLRASYYFYYAWSIAHVKMHRPTVAIDTAALADELIRRQNADGSFTNRYTDAKEDDPLVATPLALAALMLHRTTLQTQEAEHATQR